MILFLGSKNVYKTKNPFFVTVIMKKFIICMTLLGTLGGGFLFSAELINDIIAVVGDLPITSYDLAEEKKFFTKRAEYKKDGRNIDSRILDFLINRTIVFYNAKQEAVTISDARVEDSLKQQMAGQGTKTEKAFERLVKKQFGFTLAEYREEVRFNMLSQSILQMKVQIPPPEDKEVEQWFKKNKRKLGKKFKIRLIRKRYKQNDVKDELKINRLLDSARQEALKDFSAAARKYSDHSSRSSGGALGWLNEQEIYAVDMYVLNMVMQFIKQKGRGVTPVFKGKGYYYIVKIDAYRSVEYADVKEYVKSMLYNIKRSDAFKDWLKLERKRISVIIYMKQYQKPRL
ncbi:MAG: peptidylprolyl isomerase [Leptospirales bacterium]